MWNLLTIFKKVQKAEEQLDKVEEAVSSSFSTGAAYNASISAAMSNIQSRQNSLNTAASYSSFYDAHQYMNSQQNSYYYILPVYITVLDICSATYVKIPEIIEKAGYEEIYYKIPAFIAKDGALASCYYVDADGIMRLDKELLEACETVEIVR